MDLRFLIVLCVFVALVQGSVNEDIAEAEVEAPQAGYLPVEDAVEPQHGHHHEPAEVGHHHHGGHHYQAQVHHHEHGPHHHLESHHHLSESYHQHHLAESHHHVLGSHHHHLEAPLHSIHGHHGHHGHYGHHVSHLHHHRNCHATIHCPRTHSATYATDGHSCYHVGNACELAILNCLRRNELQPVLRHISQHECHHLPTARRSH
ncbi:histidine-rich glycoprotein [Drosophila kikkawai]|uniref:Histidine-rich glycoprotein n=1 Tax=Drosophila kikkawai TaxID=30033 RepID=A0A6P4IKH0_DROKI|nr:histidine-rich protein PFHRP-II [Drosophila kikkawai]